MAQFYPLLSFLPILLLLIISILRGVKIGVYASLVVSALLFFLSGSSGLTFLASAFSAFIGTVNIMMIIFGAVLLYHVMEQKQYIAQIRDSLNTIHPEKNFRFYFLAFFLTAFFEGVAGFGTPGAIVPLLLIAMGYSAVLSISVVLLIDGFFAISGAVGTPVIAGLELPLQLSADTVGLVYFYATLATLISGIFVVAFIQRYLEKESGEQTGLTCWVLYAAIIIPFAGMAYWLKELTGIISALFLALFAYLFLFRNRQINLKPWAPYGLLVGLLLLPKLFPAFGNLLTYNIQFTEIYDTGVSASLQPFRSPLIPFIAAAAFALYRVNDYKIDLKPVVNKSLAVFLVLFPSLVITQLLMNSGGAAYPSMIDAIAGVFVQTGKAYPLFSPLIGVTGSFITGSTTVSNIIFGPVQYNAAQSLGLPPAIILGLQLAGGSLGNAVCLFNIIAAAAVAGIKDYNAILKKNLLPVVLASLAIAGVGYGLLYVTL